jgi:small subunit ribosomal protein S9
MDESERPDDAEQPDPPAEESGGAAGEEQSAAAAEEEAAAAAQSAPEPEQAADEPPEEVAVEESEAAAPEAAAPDAAAPEAAAPEAAAPEAPEAPAAEEPRRERPGPGGSGGPDVIPGADLEPDIVPEGFDPLGRSLADAEALPEGVEVLEEDVQPVAPEAEGAEPDERAMPQAAIDLAAGARYTATGKRKTAVARVILRPGSGAYTINGRSLDAFFPRSTLQRNIRQPLETVGYEARMDVHARLHGGGVSAQAGALRHGISRALIAADPNLRGELKRRGFLTRDARAKERKKAGLKKARKRPQFSKR